jgi:hypothetical protein
MNATNVTERDGWKRWDVLIPRSQSTANPSPASAFSHLYDDSLVSSSGMKPARSNEPPRLPSEAIQCGLLIPSPTGESGCGS